jgi:hypothetical protein
MPFQRQFDSGQTATPLPEKFPPVFHQIDISALPLASMKGIQRLGSSRHR